MTGRWALPTQPIFDFDAEIAPETDTERAEREFAERRAEQARRDAARQKAEQEARRKAEQAKREQDARDRFRQWRDRAKDSDDPYTVLGVTRTATQSQIRSAWAALVAMYHTDRPDGGNPDMIRKVNAAYQRLKSK